MQKHGLYRRHKPSQPPTHLAGETANSFTLALALTQSKFAFTIHNLHYLHFHCAHKFGLLSPPAPRYAAQWAVNYVLFAINNSPT